MEYKCPVSATDDDADDDEEAQKFYSDIWVANNNGFHFAFVS